MAENTVPEARGLKAKLEIATNIAVLVAAAVVVAYFGAQFLRGGSPRLPAGPRAGSRLVGLEGYSFTANRKTLILALRTDCKYCEASIPFYKELATTLSLAACGENLLAVFPDDQASVQAFLSSEELAVPAVSNVSLTKLGVSGTPTLILVNDQGTVLEAWVGQLAPEQERKMLEEVRSQSLCGDSNG